VLIAQSNEVKVPYEYSRNYTEDVRKNRKTAQKQHKDGK
jgi:hypothetical protein